MDVTVIKSLSDRLPENLRILTSVFPEDLLDVEFFQSQATLVIRPQSLRKVIQYLKADAGFEMLLDLFALDYSKFDPAGSSFVPKERFAVVYILHSMTRGQHFRLKVYVPEEGCELDSIHDLYRAANWFEREAWDLFGVVFRAHPNLARILCHTEFVGHALRKEYPSDHYQRLKNASPSSGF